MQNLPLATTHARSGIGCVAERDGLQIGIVGPNIESLAAVWSRLVPEIIFDPKQTQPVVLLSAKELIFQEAK